MGLRESGGNCLKYLKRGWDRKDGRGNKDFKKGASAGSRSWCLKKGGDWSPLQTIVFDLGISMGITQFPGM